MVFFVLDHRAICRVSAIISCRSRSARKTWPFPRFNMMSFWMTFVAFVVLIAAFFVPDGPPLSRLDRIRAVERRGVGEPVQDRAWVRFFGPFRSRFSASGQLLGSLNFIATTLDLRAEGHER